MTATHLQPTSHWLALLVWSYATLWGVSLGHLDEHISTQWTLGGSLWLGAVLWNFPLALLVRVSSRCLPALPELLCRWLLVNALLLALLV